MALNLQTPGLPRLLNAAFFSRNGGVGYVLKPYILRERDSYDMYRIPQDDSVVWLTVTIEIISAILISPDDRGKGNNAIAVEVSTHFHPLDQAGLGDTSVFRTDTSTSLHPTWGGDYLCRFDVTMPEHAYLRFSLLNCSRRNSVIGVSMLPLCMLREGIRSLALRTVDGTPLATRLLIGSSVTRDDQLQHTPEGLDAAELADYALLDIMESPRAARLRGRHSTSDEALNKIPGKRSRAQHIEARLSKYLQQQRRDIDDSHDEGDIRHPKFVGLGKDAIKIGSFSNIQSTVGADIAEHQAKIAAAANRETKKIQSYATPNYKAAKPRINAGNRGAKHSRVPDVVSDSRSKSSIL